MGASSKHFSSAELSCKHGKNECSQLLVDSLEQLRAIISAATKVDTPVHVDDAFRCAICNAALKNAATHSQHMLGTAADVSVAGLSAVELFHFADQVGSFNSGGIGRADLQGYIHVDVRLTRARWCYDRHGAVVAWYDPPHAIPGHPSQA